MISLFRNLFGSSPCTPAQQASVSVSGNLRPAPAAPHAAPPRRRARPVYGADRIGLVGFNDQGFIIAVPAEPFAPWLLERSQRLHLHVKGCTNVADGLRKAIGMLERAPAGVWRRIWLLSDGYPNVDVAGITPAVQAAAAARIGINTIGFGDQYDEALLQRISREARGRFVSVKTLQQLTEALVRASGNDARRNQRRHQSETSVLAIDLSGSMSESMEGKTKVAVVEEAVLQLLHYKQKCWS